MEYTINSIEWYKETFKSIFESDMTQYENQDMAYQLLLNFRNDYSFDDKEAYEYGIKVSNYIRNMAEYVLQTTGNQDFEEIYWNTRLFEARNYQVDSGLLYLEKNRQEKERFYEPRREVFMKHGIIQAFQDLIDDKIDFMSVSLPPGTGKSTIEIFFLSLVGGWFPNNFNLSSAHSSILTRSLYDGINEILDDPIEYTWHEIFSNVKEQGTNAKETTINLERAGRFKTWTFRSIDGSLTGATRCDKFLTADDLVSGIEEALNKNRLDTLWTKVVNDLRSRRLDGCKEIYFATRWSVHDPIGRMQSKYEGSDRATIIAVPALNEKGESNFMYKYNGFSAKYFLDQKDAMDDLSFDALYQQKPLEREGLLFPVQRLRRFFYSQDQVPEKVEDYILYPDREPDAIWGVCDTKDKGTDFESFVIAYQFGEDFFIPDVVFTDIADYETIDKKNANLILKHNPHMVRFESNSAGGRVAYNCETIIKGQCRTSIEAKMTTANKETKILVNSNWIMTHCIFLHSTLYHVKSEYGMFMGNVVSYTTMKVPPHDDAPDSLAMLAEFVQKPKAKETQVIDSPY